MKQQKTVIIHDFLREYGGAERVLESLHKMYPDAPVYVAFLDKKSLGKHWQRFADWDIRETWFAKIPFHKKLYSPLRFLSPHAFAALDLMDYDIVISSSNAFMAKAVHAKKGKHVCYCHTPPRSLYGYSTMSSWKKNPIIKFFGTLINHYMRVMDVKVAQEVDYFIANSHETRRRIKKFYKRNSKVIYPPVQIPEKLPKDKQTTTDKQTTSDKKPALTSNAGEYYFYIGRLGLQKHPELAVAACNKLHLPLKVAGTGQMLESLKAMAGPTIKFCGAVSDEELNKLYAGAKALIFPVEDEDFGIVPVEAMGHGVPVIAHKSGGPMETVLDGKTGILFEELTVEGLVRALVEFEKLETKNPPHFSVQKIHTHAQIFDQERFQREVKQFVIQIDDTITP